MGSKCSGLGRVKTVGETQHPLSFEVRFRRKGAAKLLEYKAVRVDCGCTYQRYHRHKSQGEPKRRQVHKEGTTISVKGAWKDQSIWGEVQRCGFWSRGRRPAPALQTHRYEANRAGFLHTENQPTKRHALYTAMVLFLTKGRSEQKKTHPQTVLDLVCKT